MTLLAWEPLALQPAQMGRSLMDPNDDMQGKHIWGIKVVEHADQDLTGPLMQGDFREGETLFASAAQPVVLYHAPEAALAPPLLQLS